MMSRAWHRMAGSKPHDNQSINQPSDQSINHMESKEEIVEEKHSQLSKQSINQSIDQSMNIDGHSTDAPLPSAPGGSSNDQSISQSINQPINQPVSETFSNTFETPVKPVSVESSNQPMNQPINQSLNQSVSQPFCGAPIASVAVMKPKPIAKSNIVKALTSEEMKTMESSNQSINHLILDGQVDQHLHHSHEVVNEYFVPPPEYQPNEQFNQPINQSISVSSYPPQAFPVAVPPMTDVHPSVSERLSSFVDVVLASRAVGYAHRMFDRAVTPELRAFIMKPSLGALLFSPRLLFQAYGLFSAVKAPFVDVFKGIIVGAALKAVDAESQSSDHSLKHRLMLRSLKKVARSKEFEDGSLSGDVMRVIVNNLSMNQITQLFTIFGRTSTVTTVPAAI